jgi:hypothetical protein
MAVDGGDPKAKHRRKGAPGPETRSLLERWQAALRAELGDVLAELRPEPGPAQLAIDGTVMPRPRVDLTTRMKLVDLGVRIAHELGTELDTGERSGPADRPERPRARSRVEFGPELPRAALADAPTPNRRG